MKKIILGVLLQLFPMAGFASQTVYETVTDTQTFKVAGVQMMQVQFVVWVGDLNVGQGGWYGPVSVIQTNGAVNVSKLQAALATTDAVKRAGALAAKKPLVGMTTPQ